MGVGEYYDRQGNVITLDEWIELRTPEYRTVGQEWVGDLWVSTVWLGMDHSWGSGPPLIFETMIFGPYDYAELAMWRWSREAGAQVGHVAAVAVARKRRHGWTKHVRDRRRQKMKRIVRGEPDVFEVFGVSLRRDGITRR